MREYYLANKWHTIRIEWIKLYAVINIKNFEIIDYAITDEHVNDAKEAINIIKIVRNCINKLFRDKGSDSKAIYNELEG